MINKKLTLISISILLSFCHGAFAESTATVYKWKQNGSTVFSDLPQAGKPAQNITPQKKNVEADDTQTTQTQVKQEPQKEAKPAQKSNEYSRDSECQKAKFNASMLESGQKIQSVEENGSKKALSDADIARMKLSTAQSVKAWCSSDN
jgi:hypothetical protein